ncbi:efflux RND transporter periplasmic adaptor subunit [Clostridiaceae bacterium HSG29]|nr:efflux RND transporter periplasmic adaptor subunit [Clostridiaceae bacterium HSG29]
MNKKIFCLLIIFMIVISGCSSEKVIENTSPMKRVKVQDVVVEEHDIFIEYNGIVVSDEITKLAFKYSGKIAEVMVNENEKVEENQLLMTLDTNDIIESLNANKKDFELANSEYAKAVNSFNYIDDKYKKMKLLFNEGSISKNDLDDMNLQYDIAKSNLQLSKSNIDKANIGITSLNKTIEDYNLYSNIKGEIISILAKKGEMIQAGYPVVIINENIKKVSFGVTQEDYNKLKINDEIDVYFNDKIASAKIVEISNLPDNESRTYEIKAQMEGINIPLNSIVKIKFSNEKVIGALIPIDTIVSGVTDFVFVIENGKSKMKDIEILNIVNNNVIVSGIENGEKLVIKGMKGLKKDQEVKILR